MLLYDQIASDVRFKEGLKSCMNCGVCTAICPAAEFSDYDPRVLLSIVQSKDEAEIEKILKSDIIWLCGQCMSCKTRCGRGNCPGQIVSVLRKVSQENGFFLFSKKGKQQLEVIQSIGKNIFTYGYCVHPEALIPEKHPEQGSVWEWMYHNKEKVYEKLGANLDQDGAGTLRKISVESMNELMAIFEVTGGTDFIRKVQESIQEEQVTDPEQNEESNNK